MKLKIVAKPKDALIFGVFCLFLLYVVAVVVLNLYYVANENIFWGLNPFPAFGKDFIGITILIFIITVISIVMSTSDRFFSLDKGIGFGKKKEKEESGWAKWRNADDMKKALCIKKITLKDEKYDSAGLPVILNEKEAYIDDGEYHSLIIGSSGSGKTYTLIDPAIKILGKAGESMIIADLKGELYENNANILKDLGYNVILVNFVDPEQGNAWNPLSLPYKYYKEGKEDKAMELLEDLAANIMITPNNPGEPFWESAAKSFFTGLAIGLFEDATDEKEVNLNSINLMATIGDTRRGPTKYDKEYFKIKGNTSSAYISASITIDTADVTKGSIMATFKDKITLFSSRKNLSEMLSYTDFDIFKIGQEKTAVFLKIHDEKTTYHALATIFIKQVYESLISESRKGENLKLKIRTNFLLDEFANMPALKDVETMITASRSRNMRFTFVIQNYSQLNKVYGKDVAETIKGNCGNIFYLLTTEYAALEELSKLIGDQKPKKEKDKPEGPIRPLVTVSDLQQMKKFEMIIKRWREQPFKTKHTTSFEINKTNGFGFEQKQATYPIREAHEVLTFDLKKFVDDKLGEVQSSGFPGMPFNPFSQIAPSTNKPQSPSANPFATSSLSDEIDKQIKDLEEKELTKNKSNIEENSLEEINDFEKLINKKYYDYEIDSNKKEEIAKPVDIDEIIKRIDNQIKKYETQLQNNNPISEQIAERITEEEKNDNPKVTIDNDSIIKEDNKDEDFFDDFFSDE